MGHVDIEHQSVFKRISIISIGIAIFPHRTRKILLNPCLISKIRVPATRRTDIPLINIPLTMSRKLAISDIHGCAKTFIALLDHLAFSQSDTLYLLGDYIDRGPDSKSVVDYILRLKQDGYQVHCLRGNHEQLLLNAIADPAHDLAWTKNGGMDMLRSYGIDHQRDLPQSCLDFVQSLDYYFETEGFILVHAGLDFIRQDPFYDTWSMMWIRDWYHFIRYEWLAKRIIVHGHTPVFREEIESQFSKLSTQQYLDIDNGCVFAAIAGRRGLGNLCCFDLTNRALFFQPYTG